MFFVGSYCIVIYFDVLRCIVLHFAVMYCIVLCISHTSVSSPLLLIHTLTTLYYSTSIAFRPPKVPHLTTSSSSLHLPVPHPPHSPPFSPSPIHPTPSRPFPRRQCGSGSTGSGYSATGQAAVGGYYGQNGVVLHR